MRNLILSSFTVFTMIASSIASAQAAPKDVPADQLDAIKSAAVQALSGYQLNCLVRGYAIVGGCAQISPSQLISGATDARIDDSSLPTSEFVTSSLRGQIAVWVVMSQDKTSLNSVLIIDSELTSVHAPDGSIVRQLVPLTIKECKPL